MGYVMEKCGDVGLNHNGRFITNPQGYQLQTKKLLTWVKLQVLGRVTRAPLHREAGVEIRAKTGRGNESRQVLRGTT